MKSRKKVGPGKSNPRIHEFRKPRKKVALRALLSLGLPIRMRAKRAITFLGFLNS
jgi:hypothetical protein